MDGFRTRPLRAKQNYKLFRQFADYFLVILQENNRLLACGTFLLFYLIALLRAGVCHSGLNLQSTISGKTSNSQ
jgi:hypothetical protein